MGQDLIFSYLNDKRVIEPDSFFTIKDIEKVMKENGLPCMNIYKSVNKLYAWGFLDIKMEKGGIEQMYRRRMFRLKAKFIRKDYSFTLMCKEYNRERNSIKQEQIGIIDIHL
jgi:hypothetical protein